MGQINNSKELALKTTEIEMTEIAKKMIQAKMLDPEIDMPKAMMIMQRGKEIGIPPAQALAEIYVVKNRAMLKAELQLQMAIERIPGFNYDILKLDNNACTIRYRRTDREPFEYTYDINKAKQTRDCYTKDGLVKDMWKKRTELMLFYRNVTNALRMFAPDYKTLNFEIILQQNEGEEAIKDLTEQKLQSANPDIQEERSIDPKNHEENMIIY